MASFVTRRYRTIQLLAVLALALSVRLVVIAQTANFPTIRHLVGDAAGYHQWAGRIAEGDWIGSGPFYQAPLYPYVLAAYFRLVGDEVWKTRVLQAIWGSLAVVLLASSGRRLFSAQAGLIAGIMMALYGPAVYFDGIVQKASLSNLLVCSLLFAAAVHWQRRRASSACCIGVVLALLCLTRENALVWTPIVFAWVVWTMRVAAEAQAATRPSVASSAGPVRVDSGRPGEASAQGSRGLPARRDDIPPAAQGGYVSQLLARPSVDDAARSAGRGMLCGAAAVAVGMALVLAPVAIRNRAVGGEWSVSTFQAGPNFYIGNHRGATGRYVPLVPGHETPQFEQSDATALAQADAGRELSGQEVSRYWLRRSWKEIRLAPGEWAKLLGRKVLMTWNEYEVADAESLYAYADSSFVLATLRRFHFGVLAPLAAVGVIATWELRRRLWLHYLLLVSMTIAVAAFYIMARYRYPLAPILMLFAAAGIVQIVERVRARAYRRVVAPVAVGMIAAVVCNWPVHDERRLNAMARMNIGVSLAEAGEIASATGYFAAAVAENPASPAAHNNLAQALAVGGDFHQAIDHYRTALTLAPDLPGVWYNLGVALEQTGDLAGALAAFQQALRENPDDADAGRAVERLRNRLQ